MREKGWVSGERIFIAEPGCGRPSTSLETVSLYPEQNGKTWS